MREALLGASLLCAAGLVVRGVSMWDEASAYVVAGVLLAAVAGVFLVEVRR